MKVRVEVLKTVVNAGAVVNPAAKGEAPVYVEAEESVAARWVMNGSAREAGAEAPTVAPTPPALPAQIPAPPADGEGDDKDGGRGKGKRS